MASSPTHGPTHEDSKACRSALKSRAGPAVQRAVTRGNHNWEQRSADAQVVGSREMVLRRVASPRERRLVEE